MSAPAADQLDPIEYTGDFFGHLAPAWMCHVASKGGFRAPSIERGFTACDLGCGKGVTTLILAANHPHGEFHGCDLSDAHIGFAERVKAAAGLRNAHFHARSFAAMHDADVPQFDFITLHGVYSWVSPAVRDEIHALIRKCLAPGGLVMVSYNAQPGWSQLEPLRMLLRQTAQRQSGDAAERVRKAFAYVRAIARDGAGYFATSPLAVQQLERIASEDLRYVVHEYLAPDGDPFHFHEVAAAMRGIGLAYAGSMTASDDASEHQARQRFAALVDADPGGDAWQMHVDYVGNTRFRRDLYAAGGVGGGGSCTPLDRLDGVRFALTRLPSALPPVRNDVERADADAWQPMLAMLARGPADAQSLRDTVPTAGDAAVAARIAHMVAAGYLVPCPPTLLSTKWQPVNSALIDAGLAGHAPLIALACARTGLATYVEAVLGAVIETVATSADAADAARTVLARVRRHAHPVNRVKQGISLAASNEEVLAFAKAAWRELNEPANPQRRTLELLGVLAPA